MLLFVPSIFFSIFSAQGVPKQNRKSKMKTEMKKEHGADWRLVQTCSPSFFCSEKINDFQPTAKIKKLSAEKRKANQKQKKQQFSVSYWSSQPRQDITPGLPYTAHNPLPERQHRSPVNSQQANHNNSPNVLGPLFPGVRAKAKIIGDDFSMIPSRTTLEVRSQYNLKFDPGASTSDAPPPPWEAQRPPGVEMSSCMPAALVDLCCRTLDCRHVLIVLNGP